MDKTKLDDIFSSLAEILKPDEKEIAKIDCMKLIQELHNDLSHYKKVEEYYGNVDLTNLLKVLSQGCYRLDERKMLRYLDPKQFMLTRAGLYYGCDVYDNPHILLFENYGKIQPDGWAATEGELM